MVRKLLWTGLLAGSSALATILAHRISTVIWIRVFNEEPPE
jgi:hypothetical protein